MPYIVVSLRFVLYDLMQSSCRNATHFSLTIYAMGFADCISMAIVHSNACMYICVLVKGILLTKIQ